MGLERCFRMTCLLRSTVRNHATYQRCEEEKYNNVPGGTESGDGVLLLEHAAGIL